MTEHHVGQQNMGDDRLKASSVVPKALLANSALDAYQPSAATKPPRRTGEEALSVHDIDRKDIHILVVEDK